MSENDKKRNKPDDTNTSPIQDISNRDLAKLIAEQTKTTKQQFNQLGEELRNELKQGLMGINQELRDVRSSLEQIKLDVMDNTEAIARTERSSDLIVSGVPYTREEDLYSYFRHWCLALGYTQHSVPSVDIRRLTRTRECCPSQTLIIANAVHRNDSQMLYGANAIPFKPPLLSIVKTRECCPSQTLIIANAVHRNDSQMLYGANAIRSNRLYCPS
ncbi:hypothetical protein quinque_013927 [Culex quinquefasciatus]